MPVLGCSRRELRLPGAGVAVFLKNDVFVKGDKRKAYIEIGKAKPWWKPAALKDREDHQIDLPKGEFLEVIRGREGADFVIYLSWMTT